MSDNNTKIYTDPIYFHRVCKNESFQGPTSGQCPGFAQANLCILPKEYAYDFLVFCQRNPKPCPLLHVLDPGQYLLDDIIDIRHDLPKYRVYIDGKLSEEVLNLNSLWREDLVTFVIGCSFSFEAALEEAGLKIRHIEEGCNVPMYNTNIPCKSAGQFSSNMVVSMRPFSQDETKIAYNITAKYPRVHGAPVYIGDPSTIGILDINRPDYGDAVTLKDGDVPVFWACGVTPQAAVMKSKPSFCITHAPGHMLILNETNESLSL